MGRLERDVYHLPRQWCRSVAKFQSRRLRMGYHVLCQTPGLRMLGCMDPVDYDQFHFCICSYKFNSIFIFIFILHIHFYARISFQEFLFLNNEARIITGLLFSNPSRQNNILYLCINVPISRPIILLLKMILKNDLTLKLSVFCMYL